MIRFLLAAVACLAACGGQMPPQVHVPPPLVAPTRGSEDAPIVIEIFSDFQCPYCARAVPTIMRLEHEFPGQIRLVFRGLPLPFHPQAETAQAVALEVFAQGGNDAFWRFHDLAFANQHALWRHDLVRYAAQAGNIDIEQLNQALDTNRHLPTIEHERRTMRQLRGGRLGAPVFFINGHVIMGAQPYDSFEDLVERLLRR